MKAAARFLLVAALMISIGLHWAVMQSAAWVGMTVANTVKTGSVAQGLSDTFDGQHPCALCHLVEAGIKEAPASQDSKSPQEKKIDHELKLSLVAVILPGFVNELPPKLPWLSYEERAITAAQAPEAPVPRFSLVG